MADLEVDILIIGGGLIGALLSIALSNSQHKTLMIDAHSLDIKTKEDFDARSIALSKASKNTLKTLGVWEDISKLASPIHRIHVSEQGRFGLSNLRTETDDALGYVIEAQALFKSITPKLDREAILAPATLTNIDVDQKVAYVQTNSQQQSIKAKLIIAADGTQSRVRELVGLQAVEKSYAQSAVVANIGLSRDHMGVAYERFTKNGALALLPMTKQRSALVWSMPITEALTFQNMPEKDFLNALQKTFGYRLGRFNKLGRRSVFPLKQVIMKQQVSGSFVFIGNAAHTLHPVAGQGFNLGLRDVAMLAQTLVNKPLTKETVLNYQAQRQHDQKAITMLTNGLIEGFSKNIPGVGSFRGVGLLAFDNMPFLKNKFVQYASGYGGVIPDLVCEIPLEQDGEHD